MTNELTDAYVKCPECNKEAKVNFIGPMDDNRTVSQWTSCTMCQRDLFVQFKTQCVQKIMPGVAINNISDLGENC